MSVNEPVYLYWSVLKSSNRFRVMYFLHNFYTTLIILFYFYFFLRLIIKYLESICRKINLMVDH